MKGSLFHTLVGVKWISDNYALHIYCLIAVICVYWNVLNIECHTIHRSSVFAPTQTVFIWRTNTTSQRWSCWTSFCTYLEMLAQYRTSVWIFFLFEEFRCSINLSLQITVSYGINTQTFTRQTNTKLKDISSNSDAHWRSVNQFEFHYYFERDCISVSSTVFTTHFIANVKPYF